VHGWYWANGGGGGGVVFLTLYLHNKKGWSRVKIFFLRNRLEGVNHGCKSSVRGGGGGVAQTIAKIPLGLRRSGKKCQGVPYFEFYCIFNENAFCRFA
jgi:hypothetical protein